jgi:hypothetical protein
MNLYLGININIKNCSFALEKAWKKRHESVILNELQQSSFK